MENNNDINSKNNKKKKKKKKKSNSNFKKFIIILLIAVVALFGAGIGTGYYFLNKVNNKIHGNKSVPVKQVQEDGIVNILIMGTDAGTPGSNSEPKRTDTIMLLHYNPKTTKATLVSIPRDTMVQLNGKTNKINEANFQGGATLAVSTVENLLGVKLNYYAKVDLNGFIKIIDILGGIDMTITRRMDYDDNSQNLHIHFTKGQTVNLNGQKAMEFFRWRENNDGTGLANGDLDRINIQHTFIQKVIEKVKTPAVIPKIPSILSTVADNIETNMDAQDIVKYGTTLSGLDSSNINITTLKGEGKYVGQVSYFIWNKGQDTELLNTLREGSNSATSTTTTSNIDRSNLKVKVLNGTNKSGLATAYSEILKKNGYINITTGNAKSTSQSKVMLYGTASTNISSLQNDFKVSNILTSDAKSDYDIIITLGSDYKQ